MLVDARVPVADLGEARRHRREREVRGLAGVDLVPGQRRRHARVRRRPHRVGARHRAVLRVLVVVEEHAVALFLPPLARGQSRARAARPRAPAPAPPGAPRRTSSAARCARRRACRASPTSSASRRGRSRRAWRCTTPRDLADLAPRDARHRIEIDAQLVGMIEIVGAHRMRVQLEAGEVGHPRERRGIARHDFLRGAAGRKAQRDDLDPRRAATAARASDRRTRRRCRSDSARARWAVRRRRAARRPPRRGSSARDRASCSPAAETAPCADSRSRPRGRRRSGALVRCRSAWI